MANIVSKCVCGARKSKYLDVCKKCLNKAIREHNEEYNKHVQTGICPTCGSKLIRNLSLTGWYQCEQVGAETHRARPQDAPCNFQFSIREMLK